MDAGTVTVIMTTLAGAAATVVTLIVTSFLNRRKTRLEERKLQVDTEIARDTLNSSALSSARSMITELQTETARKDKQLLTVGEQYDSLATQVNQLKDNIKALEAMVREHINTNSLLRGENSRLGERLTIAEKALRILTPATPGEVVNRTIEGFSHPTYADIFFTSLPFAVSYVAADGRFIDVNTAWIRMLGYTRAEMRTLTFQEITHPDDLSGDLAMVDVLLNNRDVNHYSIKKRYITKDAHHIDITLLVRPVWANGIFQHFVAFAFTHDDLTAYDN